MTASNAIAICSAVVAFCALLFSIIESRRGAKIARLNAIPRLDYRVVLNRATFDDEVSGIYIVNTGIGPAIVRKCELRLDGKSYDISNKDELLRYVDRIAATTVEHGVHAIKPGVYIPPGDSRDPITFHPSGAGRINAALFESTKVYGTYDSIFGERFELTPNPQS